MSDTSAPMAARHRAMLLARPEGERFAVASAMFDLTRRILIASIRAGNPGIGELELRQELFLRLYGEEFTAEQRERILAAIAAHWRRTGAERIPGGGRALEPTARPSGAGLVSDAVE